MGAEPSWGVGIVFPILETRNLDSGRGQEWRKTLQPARTRTRCHGSRSSALSIGSAAPHPYLLSPCPPPHREAIFCRLSWSSLSSVPPRMPFCSPLSSPSSSSVLCGGIFLRYEGPGSALVIQYLGISTMAQGEWPPWRMMEVSLRGKLTRREGPSAAC